MDRFLAINLNRRIRKLRVDVVWMNSVASWKVAKAVAPQGVPRVLHVHELTNVIRTVGPPHLRDLNIADFYVAASNSVLENLVETYGVDQRKITTVYSSVPARSSRPLDPCVRSKERSSLGIGPDDVVLAACGVGTSAKGFDLVGQLLFRLARIDTLPPVHLIWVGRVESKVLSSLRVDMERLGVEGALHLPGEVDDPRQFFELADIFVLPSREEAFPLVVLEAAQCCLPTVCFAKAGGAPEFVGHDAGKVVPYLDLDSFAVAVTELVLDPKQRRRFGERALTKVEELYSVENQSPKMVELLERVAAIGSENATSATGAATQR